MISKINFPRTLEYDIFEDLICDLLKEVWGDENTQRYGRSGQKQNGIDIFGRPIDSNGKMRGAQCKLRSKDDQLSENEIIDEIKKADNFEFDLDKFILITDASRDTKTQDIITKINYERTIEGKFIIQIWFWEDVTVLLSRYPKIIINYFPSLFTGISDIRKNQTLNVYLYSENENEIIYTLRNFGIHVDNNLNFFDGIIVEIDDKTNLSKILLNINSIYNNEKSGIPIILISFDEEKILEFTKLQETLNIKFSNIICILKSDFQNNIRNIFHLIFEFGYKQRGKPSIINMTIRSIQRKHNSLLDIDISDKLSINNYPPIQIWEDYLVKIFEIIKNEISNTSGIMKINMNPILQIPAAIYLGYLFNIREFDIGVWTRKNSTSEINEQFWDSNNGFSQGNHQIIKNIVDKNCAVIELTSNDYMTADIVKFCENSGINTKSYLKIKLERNEEGRVNINEDEALSFVNQVAQEIRNLRSSGMMEFFLFAKIPSSLAFLLGQRLLACGKINLYWFDDPTYIKAFNL